MKELKLNTNIKYLDPNIISTPFSKNDITTYEKVCPNIAFDKHVFCNNSEFYDELNEMTDDEKEEWEDKICRGYIVKRTLRIYDVNITGNGDKNIVVYFDGLYRENNRENYDSERILKLKKRGVFRQWKYESAPYKKTAGTDIEEGKYLLYNLKNCSVVSGVGTIYAKYNHRLKENNNNYNGIFIYKDNYYIYNLYTYGQDNGYRFKLNKLNKNTGKFSSYCSFHYLKKTTHNKSIKPTSKFPR